MRGAPSLASARAIGVAAATAILALAAPIATAQTAPPEKAAPSREDPRSAKGQESERRAKALQAEVSAIDEEQAKLNAELLEMARRVQRSEAQLTALEGRRDLLEAERRQRQGELDSRRGEIAQLLGAMQRMGRNPPPVIITKREDALEMVRSAMLLARAFPELKTKAEFLAGRLTEIASIIDGIRVEREKVQAESQWLKDAQARLAGLVETKKRTITERRQELVAVRREAEELKSKFTDLNDLIGRLEQTVSERTGLGSYERTLAEEAAGATAPSGEPRRASGGTTVALLPKGTIESGSLKRMTPTMRFQLTKARLPLPASGRRVLSFGEKTQYGAASKGIVIETRHAARITSPCDGWVVYAGDFRSYGQLLIINAGDGYHVLLAGLSQIDVQLGQFLLTSEPVGTMRSAQAGAAPEHAPVLYVEFRKDGKPIDPEPWWADGVSAEAGLKVQG